MVELTVIICTHNPTPEFLRRVLDALKVQTLAKDHWELLLMDNASKEQLATIWDLSWHRGARHIREDKVGKTNAILTAIREAKSPLLMIVDDDNVLDSDYLEKSLGISKEFPFLGAWAGDVEGEFEAPLPDWLAPHLSSLAVRRVDKDYWSNYFADNRSMPFGAGMTVRKHIAEAYARELVKRPASVNLGRKGVSLVSGEDIDLALTAHDLGLGTGMFRRLHLTHIIPQRRMTVEYLCRLLEGIEYSDHLLKYQRNPKYVPPQENSKLRRWLRAYQVWRLPEPNRSIVRAEERGLKKAHAEIAAVFKSQPASQN